MHSLQAKDFTPVWIRIWRAILDFSFIILLQKGHCEWPFSSTIGSIICKNILNSKFISKNHFLTMILIEMSLQIGSLIWWVSTFITIIVLYSSMNLDMTFYLGFNNFATQRTLILTILKKYWLNNLKQYLKFQIYLLCKKTILTMPTIEMSSQFCSFICCITALITTIGLYSSMNHDMTCYLGFENFATQRTLILTIFKKDWLNNL